MQQMYNLVPNAFLIVVCCISYSASGPNDLHFHEGTGNAGLINGDIFFEILDPSELEYTYRIRPAKDFGAPFNASFSVQNIPLVPVRPDHGCDMLENVDEVEGNVALIERGECSFKTKTMVAERAGAQAVIITDISKTYEDYYIEMVDDESAQEVHIPAAFLMGKNGRIIRRTLQQLNKKYALINLPVNITFTPVNQINVPPWMGW